MIPLTLAKRQALRQAALQGPTASAAALNSSVAAVGIHAQLLRSSLAAPSATPARRGLSTTHRPVAGLPRARPQPAARSRLPTHRAFSSTPTRRTPLTPPTAPFAFLTGYSFAGKPRGPASPAADSQETDRERTSSAAPSTSPAELPQQGFPSTSEIGKWRDELLRGKDAGEDSLMCAAMKGDGDCVIGVADGVGGWSENGVDPALFSQALMYHATKHAEKYVACPERLDAQEEQSQSIAAGDASSGTPPSSPSSSVSSGASQSTAPSSPGSTASAAQHAGSPLAILSYAYEQTLAEKAVPAGSSTATILTFDASKGVLRTANVGDSGFLVLRQGAGGSKATTFGEGAAGLRAGEGVLYASAPLQHGFNTPYQLAKLPPAMRQEGSIDSGPHDAQLWKAQLRGGDIVIVGTDGYFDNVSQSETTQLVKFVGEKHHQAWSAQNAPGQDTSGKDPLAEERSLVQTLAHNLAQYAIMCMGSQTKTSPFEREAARHGIRYPGGKVDDVAVVAALVMEQ